MNQSPAKLVIFAGPLSGREFPLPGPVTTIGRTSGSDIVLDDRSISRSHAKIERTSSGFVVTDFGSQNGTFVNGQKITQATVPAGGCVVFGKLQCRIEVEGVENIPETPDASAANAMMQAPAAQGDWSNLPGEARPLTAEDLFGAAGGESAGGAPTGLSQEARRRRGLILYIAFLVGVVAAGLLAIVWIGRPEPPPARSVIVEVDREKLVGVSGAVEERGKFDPSRIAIDRRDVVTAEVDDEIPWIIAVTGVDEGIAEIVLSNYTGTVCVITVKVVSRRPEPRDQTRGLSQEERVQWAVSLMKEAQNLEGDYPWRAMEKYKEAEHIMRPVASNPELREAARQGSRAMNARINSLYAKLKDDFGAAYSAGSYESYKDAARALEKIKELIQDEDDRRYQRANLVLPNVLNKLERYHNRRRYGRR